jgi:hypothetical protein
VSREARRVQDVALRGVGNGAVLLAALGYGSRPGHDLFNRSLSFGLRLCDSVPHMAALEFGARNVSGMECGERLLVLAIVGIGTAKPVFDSLFKFRGFGALAWV